MKIRSLRAAAGALLLCACAHAYPSLATFPSLESSDPTDEVGRVLQTAVTLQQEYSTGYKDTAKWQDLSQLPIIGAAAVAAWILLENHKNAATRAGKIGIGTLTYTSARDQLTGKGLPDAYIAGHGALTCVLAEGSMFSGTAARARHEGLQQNLANIEPLIQEVSGFRNTEPAKPGSYAELLKAARTLADQAIAAARIAEAAALTQEGWFQQASPAFANAISSISVRVASKGRVRPPVDFGGLRDQMATLPKTPSVPKGLAESSQQRAESAARLVQDLTSASNELMEATAKLSGSTPDYKKSLDRVRDDCVKLAPS